MSTLRRTPARIALTLALPLLALAAATPAHAKRSGWSIKLA